jgi:hypothetical protein
LTIANPTSFYLTVAPPENTGVAPGSAATFAVTPKRLSGFTGAVTLSMNPDLPPGVTASFSPNPNASGASALTLQTSASTPLGSYTLAIKGVSGSVVTWDSVILDVGSFGISVTPASRTVADAGTGHTSSAAYSISLTRNSFSDNVSLSVSGLPSGATGSFSPNPIAGPSGTSSTLTVNGGTAVAGTYTLTVSGTGGAPAQTHSQQVQLVVDTVAPTTTISFPAPSGNYNAMGWANKCGSGLVTGICGTASDPNGVATVKVAIRNSSGQYWNGSTFGGMTPLFNTTAGTPTAWSYTFTPPVDGAYTTLVQATDGLGNTTAFGSETTAAFKYDTVAPATTLTTTPASPDGTNGWFKQASVQFTLMATDATSGVAATYYTVDGGSVQSYTGAVTISSQGDHTLQFYSQDNAGNFESVQTSHIKLDDAVPSTTLTINPANPNGSGGWYKTTPSFTLSATDGTSGVYQSFYRIDNGPQTLYTGAVNIPDGPHTVSYWSVDNAGNTEPQHTSGSIKVDTAAPSTSLAINPSSPSGTNGWYKGPNPPTIALTGLDGTSGVTSTTYEINGGSTHTYSGPFPLPDGSDVVTYRSTDNAGNVEATQTSSTYKVDTVPPPVPAITAHPSDPSNQPTAHFEFSDSEAGASLSCALDNAPLATCASPQDYSGLGQGPHSFQVQATDQAGNTSSTTFNWSITAAPYTIGTNPIGTLYPGGPTSKIDLTFHNPNGDTVKVSSLTVGVSSVTGGSGNPRSCDASDYAVTNYAGSSFFIPVGDSSLSSLGIPSANWPTIRMLDNGNQDGCRGATVHLDLSGNS